MKENKSMRNRMNTLLSISLASLFSLSLATGLHAQETESKATEAQAEATEEQQEDAIIAIVNGVDIKRSTLDAVMNMARRSGNSQADERSLLEDLILTEIARQEAKKSGLSAREDVQKKVENFADKLILNTWMQEKASSLEIADEDLKEAYDKLIANMPKKEYKARHILLKTKEDAEAVIKTLNEGQDFAETAKKKSTGPSAPMGGDLGWFKAQSMVKPFADAVTSMKANTISETPVETQFGFHVIKLEDQRDVKLPELDNMKPQLRRQLEQEKMREYMTGLQEKAEVKVLLPEKEEVPEPKEEEDGEKSEE